MADWNEFHQKPRAPQPPTFDPDFDTVCAIALSGGPGQRLLEALRERYIDRTENPLLPEAALRVRVTQAQFVRDLEIARDRGLDAQKRKAEAAKPTT